MAYFDVTFLFHPCLQAEVTVRVSVYHHHHMFNPANNFTKVSSLDKCHPPGCQVSPG